MRILVIEDKDLRTNNVMEIVDIGYDDDITEGKDENGFCRYDKNRFPMKPISGLYFKLAGETKEVYYIENVDINECNAICEEIFEKGYVDLRKFGVPKHEEEYYEEE